MHKMKIPQVFTLIPNCSTRDRVGESFMFLEV